jgi:hypothetical protein
MSQKSEVSQSTNEGSEQAGLMASKTCKACGAETSECENCEKALCLVCDPDSGRTTGNDYQEQFLSCEDCSQMGPF